MIINRYNTKRIFECDLESFFGLLTNEYIDEVLNNTHLKSLPINISKNKI